MAQGEREAEFIDGLGEDLGDAGLKQRLRRRRIARPHHGDHRRRTREYTDRGRELRNCDDHAARFGLEMTRRGLDIARRRHRQPASIDQQM